MSGTPPAAKSSPSPFKPTAPPSSRQVHRARTDPAFAAEKAGAAIKPAGLTPPRRARTELGSAAGFNALRP